MSPFERYRAVASRPLLKAQPSSRVFPGATSDGDRPHLQGRTAGLARLSGAPLGHAQRGSFGILARTGARPTRVQQSNCGPALWHRAGARARSEERPPRKALLAASRLNCDGPSQPPIYQTTEPQFGPSYFAKRYSKPVAPRLMFDRSHTDGSAFHPIRVSPRKASATGEAPDCPAAALGSLALYGNNLFLSAAGRHMTCFVQNNGRSLARQGGSD